MDLSWANLPELYPAWFIPTALVLFGLVIGSFLNVVIHRLPRGEFPGRKRSACPSCERQIPWYENIPVLSWAFLLRGKCAGCKTPISVRYPLVELLTGALFLAVVLATP